MLRLEVIKEQVKCRVSDRDLVNFSLELGLRVGTFYRGLKMIIYFEHANKGLF